MKIALAQFNPTVGDFAGNAARILNLAGQAKQRGADLAVFTELCLCGYPPQDLLERPAFLDRNLDELKSLAGKIPLPCLVGYAGRVKNGAGKSVANKAALMCGGRVVFEQSKMLLPTYDVFDESRYFQPADKQMVYSFQDETVDARYDHRPRKLVCKRVLSPSVGNISARRINDLVEKPIRRVVLELIGFSIWEGNCLDAPRACRLSRNSVAAAIRGILRGTYIGLPCREI